VKLPSKNHSRSLFFVLVPFLTGLPLVYEIGFNVTAGDFEESFQSNTVVAFVLHWNF